MSISLFILYNNILATILSEWISEEDMCYLDCACCNSVTRNMFLDVVAKCSMNSVLPIFDIKKDERIEWLSMRRVKVKRLELYGSPDLRYLKLTSHLDSLVIHLCLLNLEYFSSTPFSASKLKVIVSGFDDFERLKPVLQAVQDVKFLDLNCGFDSPELSSFIMSLYPKLTGIKIRGSSSQLIDLVNGCPDLVVLEDFCAEDLLGFRGFCNLRRVDQPSPTSVIFAGEAFEVIGIEIGDSAQVGEDQLSVLFTSSLKYFSVTGGTRMSDSTVGRLVQCPLLEDIICGIRCTGPVVVNIMKNCKFVTNYRFPCLTNVKPAMDLLVSQIHNVTSKEPVIGVRTAAHLSVYCALSWLKISCKRDAWKQEVTFPRLADTVVFTSLKQCLGPGLDSLEMTIMGLDDAFFVVMVKQCPNLTSLVVVGGKYTAWALTRLALLLRLQRCSLTTMSSSFEPTKEELLLLLDGRSFRRLWLPRCGGWCHEAFQLLQCMSPNLTSLDVSHSSIGDDDVSLLLRGCPRLSS